jgi:hypothetical protein
LPEKEFMFFKSCFAALPKQAVYYDLTYVTLLAELGMLKPLKNKISRLIPVQAVEALRVVRG